LAAFRVEKGAITLLPIRSSFLLSFYLQYISFFFTLFLLFLVGSRPLRLPQRLFYPIIWKNPAKKPLLLSVNQKASSLVLLFFLSFTFHTYINDIISGIEYPISFPVT
jgi:hypothetical protein